MDSLGCQPFKGVNLGPCFRPIFRDVIKGLLLVLSPFFNPVLGLRLGPAHLLFQTPSNSIHIFTRAMIMARLFA